MGCIVPPYPHNGKHAVQGISNKYPPGSTIPSSAVLRISCNNGYRLDPNNEYVFCQGNTRSWSSKIPECKCKYYLKNNIRIIFINIQLLFETALESI